MRVLRQQKPGTGRTTEDLLNSYPWFLSLPPARRQWLYACIHERKLDAGEVLTREGRVIRDAYMVLDGLLTWSVIGAGGDQVTLGTMLPGSWFGHATLLAQVPQRGNIQALRESRVACIPKDAFDWLFENSLQFNNALVRHAFARMQWFLGTLASRTLSSIEHQVARALAFMVDEQQNPRAADSIPISQEELAFLVGCSRQRCNAALKRLRTGGLIEIRYGVIRVLDKSRLRLMASGEGTPD